MSYTFSQTAAELQQGADNALAVGEINGIIKSDGNNNFSAQEVDTTPTEGSDNLLTSGGAAEALAALDVGLSIIDGAINITFDK